MNNDEEIDYIKLIPVEQAPYCKYCGVHLTPKGECPLCNMTKAPKKEKKEDISQRPQKRSIYSSDKKSDSKIYLESYSKEKKSNPFEGKFVGNYKQKREKIIKVSTKKPRPDLYDYLERTGKLPKGTGKPTYLDPPYAKVINQFPHGKSNEPLIDWRKRFEVLQKQYPQTMEMEANNNKMGNDMVDALTHTLKSIDKKPKNPLGEPLKIDPEDKPVKLDEIITPKIAGFSILFIFLMGICLSISHYILKIPIFETDIGSEQVWMTFISILVSIYFTWMIIQKIYPEVKEEKEGPEEKETDLVKVLKQIEDENITLIDELSCLTDTPKSKLTGNQTGNIEEDVWTKKEIPNWEHNISNLTNSERQLIDHLNELAKKQNLPLPYPRVKSISKRKYNTKPQTRVYPHK